MRDSPARIVQKLLLANAVFGDPASSGLVWPLYVGFLPDLKVGTQDVPDDAAAIYDTAGPKDGRIMRTGEVITHPGLQVKVRAQVRGDGLEQLGRATDFLQQVRNQVVVLGSNTYTLLNVSQQGSPLAMGIEAGTKRRFLHSVNFNVTLVPGTFGTGPALVLPADNTYERAFAWNSASPILFGSLGAGDVVLDSDVVVEVAFDDPAATIALGLASTPGSILAQGDVDPGTVGTYNNPADYEVVADNKLRLDVHPGTSTRGSGIVVVQVYRP